MLELTSDLFPFSGPAGADNGFHEGPGSPVTLFFGWFDGRLMANLSLVVSVGYGSRTACLSVFISWPRAEVICDSLLAFWKRSMPRLALLSRTHTPSSNSHISETGLRADFRQMRARMFWNRAGLPASSASPKKDNVLEAIRRNFGVCYTSTRTI